MLILPSAVEARYLLFFFFFRVCVHFFPCLLLIPSSSVLFHECAAILAVWSHGVSERMALTVWKIQCHMVDAGDCPLVSCLKPQSLLVKPCFLIPVPGLQLRSHALLLLRAVLSFLSVHVFGDLFSLFILMLRILITHLQDPSLLYRIWVFLLLAHVIASFPVSSENPGLK